MSEHMIEHVEYQAAQVMLSECFRVVKRGASDSLPQICESYWRCIAQKKTDAQTNYIDWAVARFVPEVLKCKEVFVINNFFRAWGHCFLYDQETLYHALYTTGFRDIKFYKPGDSEDPML
jgi:hypothetical protein